MSAPSNGSRRHFLQVLALAGGGLLVGMGDATAQAADLSAALLGETFTSLGPYLRVQADGHIFIGARTPDMGQGTHTTLTRIIADEFDADWERVSVVPMTLGVTSGHGKAEFILGDQSARGSTSTAAAWAELRQVGASARWLMLQAAAQRWKVDAASLHSSRSQVIAPTGATLGYGELAAAAAKLTLPPQNAALKAATDYQLIGQPAGDVDARAMVNGRQRFSIDAWSGDALIAVIARCPYLDGELQYFDASAAKAIDGVVQVITLDAPSGRMPLGSVPLAPGVAVLAKTTWAALQGRKALTLQWQPKAWADASSAALHQQALDKLADATAATVVRRDGDMETAHKQARHHLEATYQLPYLAHVTMEPLCALVQLQSDHAHLRIPTQDPAAAFAVVQALTGLDGAQIDIEFPRMGGGFGRRLDSDFVAEAVLLAQAAKRPVKLMWTREDDLVHDVYRPYSVQQMSATLDRKRQLTSWRQHMLSTSPWVGRGVPKADWWHNELYVDDPPAGLIPNLEMLWQNLDAGAARGNYRAPGHNASAFAVQCFIDEIAHASKRDPLQLRLDLLGEPRPLPYAGLGGPTIDSGRLANVLKLVAERIDWKHPRRNGHGLGIACHFTFGSYAAHAFEVSTRHGKLHFHRAVCAVDVGLAVNPLGVQAQVEGATLDALSAALFQAITVDKGQVQQHTLKHYPMARSADLPRKVEVLVVPSSAAPAGAGEVGFPSAAPALANAVFAATTVRVRKLPLLPQLKILL